MSDWNWRSRMDKYHGEIIRVKHDRQNPYVVIQRSLAQDSRLSYAARGLLLYLLSKPDDWQAQMGDLQREGELGRHAMRTILHELEEHGYLVRTCTRGAAGYWQWISQVYENPDEGREVKNRPTDNRPTDDPPGNNHPITDVESARTIESTNHRTDPLPVNKNGSAPRNVRHEGAVNALRNELQRRGWPDGEIAGQLDRYRAAGYPPVTEWLAKL
jgi:hypothetical protein